MKYLLWFLRIVVGLLFIFSGLVKANDPLGLTYKMIEFFEAWHMAFMAPYAMIFSIVMIAFEFMAGVALLLGYAARIFCTLLLLLNIFFTFVTVFQVFFFIPCYTIASPHHLGTIQGYIRKFILCCHRKRLPREACGCLYGAAP